MSQKPIELAWQGIQPCVFPIPHSAHYDGMAKWERDNKDKIALVNLKLSPIYYELALTRTIDPKYRV